jgi:tetratricopeptide (TPR) repeat protein
MADDPWKVHSTRGRAAIANESLEEAEAEFRLALEAAECFGSSDARVGISHTDLAEVYEIRGVFGQAEEHYKSAIKVFERTLGKTHTWTLKASTQLGSVYRRTKRYAQAEMVLRQTLAVWGRPEENPYTDVMDTVSELTVLLCEQRQFEAAQALLDQITTARSDKNSGNVDPVATLYDFVERNVSKGKFEEAELLLRQAISIHKKNLGEEHPEIARDYIGLSQIAVVNRHYEEAIEHLESALALRIKAYGEEHTEVAETLKTLGSVHHMVGHDQQAAESYERALPIVEKLVGSDNLEVADILHKLAVIYDAPDTYAKAEAAGKRALEIREASLGPDHMSLAFLLKDLADIYAGQEKTAEAARYEERVKGLLRGQDKQTSK